MIADAVIAFFGALLHGLVWALVHLLPVPPAWTQQGISAAGEVWGQLSMLNMWVPVTLTATVAGAVLIAYVTSLILGLARVVASYLTFGGGAT